MLLKHWRFELDCSIEYACIVMCALVVTSTANELENGLIWLHTTPYKFTLFSPYWDHSHHAYTVKPETLTSGNFVEFD